MAKRIISESTSVPTATGAEKCDELKGYIGSIQGQPIEKALNEHRMALWEAKAIIETVAAALNEHFGDWPADVIHFPLALQRACRVIDDAADGLEGCNLEDRGIAIARELRDRAEQER